MASGNKALTPDFNAFHPSAQTNTLTQMMAAEPSFGVMRIASQMGDGLNSALYQKALADAQLKNLLINQMEQRSGLLGKAIEHGDKYVKLGGAGGIDALLAQAGVVDPRNPMAFAESVRAANAAGLHSVLADATKNLGQGVKDMSIAGFTQQNPDGTVNMTNTAPLEAYVNPGDMAAMAAANKANMPEVTDTTLMGDTTRQVKYKGTPAPALGTHKPAPGAGGGNPAPTANPAAKAVVDSYTKTYAPKGWTVKPLGQPDGTTIVELSKGGVKKQVIVGADGKVR